METADSVAAQTAGETRLGNKRKRALGAVAIVLVIAAIAVVAYWLVVLRHYENTDDAYVSGNVVQVTPQVPGTVISIAADDNDFVEGGRQLVVLDEADTQLALDQAKADLARVVREVRTLFANTAAIQAEVGAHESDLQKAREDLNRRAALGAQGAVSTEEIEHARVALTNAESALSSARQKLAGNLAQTEGTTITDHPLVETAAAKVKEAFLAHRRTSIPAPVSGTVAKRTVQVGQRVQPGSPLMAIVPLDNLWVDANFKEGQLGRMRVGQPVTLESDLYGNKTPYHGKLAGVAAGTGSAFALLPAQNATGNWIKIVQRVTVRIALDKDEIKTHPLRIGLSMRARVDIADQRGSQLANLSHDAAAYTTRVFDRDTASADELIAQIIADNAGVKAVRAAKDSSISSNAADLHAALRRKRVRS